MTGRLVLDYDADDRRESARIAAIVRRDDERLRSALWALSERLRRVARGKDHAPGLSDEAAMVVLGWIDEELDEVPLALEE